MYLTIINNNFGPNRKSSDILYEIDKKIIYLSNKYIDTKRYLIESNISYDDLEDLYIYRDIYIRKLHCDACLKNYSLDLIKSKLKTLINKKYC